MSFGKLGKLAPANYAKTLRLEKYLKKRPGKVRDLRAPRGAAYVVTGPSIGLIGQNSAPFVIKPLSRILATITVTLTGKTHTTRLNFHFLWSLKPQSFTLNVKTAQVVTLTFSNHNGLIDPSLLTYTVGVVPPPIPPPPPSPVVTHVVNVGGTAMFGSPASLTATLSPNVAGKNLSFTLDSNPVGSVLTNNSGVANLTNVVNNDIVGTHAGVVVATFAGDSGYLSSSGSGDLIVSAAPPVPPPPGPLPTPPPSADFEAKVHDWGVLLNDNLGDCVIASTLHLQQAMTAYAGVEFVPSDAQALWMYEQFCGYNPNNPSTDQGCVIEDVLNGVMAKGVDATGAHKIKAFMAFDHTNKQLFEDAVYLFDGVKVGLQMPISAQNQTGPGLVWDVPPGGAIGNGARGSWGGHDVVVLAYDDTTNIFLVVTWGAIQKVTWNFFNTYCDEAYAVLSYDEFNQQGLSPENFDMAQLEADLQQY